MIARQLPYHISECGARCVVKPTASPYEFAWQCSCGESGSISWAHASEPPLFEQELPLPFNRRDDGETESDGC